MFHVCDFKTGREWLVFAESELDAKHKIIEAGTDSRHEHLEVDRCGEIVEVTSKVKVDKY